MERRGISKDREALMASLLKIYCNEISRLSNEDMKLLIDSNVTSYHNYYEAKKKETASIP